MPYKKFKVNEFITLRLENNQTNIYVKGEYFNQCKFLLLNVPTKNARSMDEINSIDEAAENLDSSMELRERKIFKIPPEVEFWGHCSNIQVWFEHNYDTRLLHSNLAFPLLKKLTDVGDPIAKKAFKEEIAKRFVSGYEQVMNYLLVEGYLDYLNSEELKSILEDINFAQLDYYKFLKNATEISNLDLLSALLKEIRKIALEKRSNYYIQRLDRFLNDFNDEAICLMPYGNFFLYITNNKELVRENLFDTEVVTEFDEIIGHIDASSKGEIISCCTKDGDINLVDVNTGKITATILNEWDDDNYEYINYEAYFTPDSKSILRIALEFSYARIDIWNIKSKNLYYSQELYFEKGYLSLAISPNSKLLAISDTVRTINIVDLKSKKILTTIKSLNLRKNLHFSKDGKYLIGLENLSLRTWDVFSGKLINKFLFNKIYSKKDDYMVYDITKPLEGNKIGIAFGGGFVGSPLFFAVIDYLNNDIIQSFQIKQENAGHGELWNLFSSKEGDVILAHFLGGVAKIWTDLTKIEQILVK